MFEGKSPFDFEEDEFLQSKVTFGMYKGWKWIDVVHHDPSYINFCIEQAYSLTKKEKQTLTEAIELIDDQ